jgi:hypothetical protein
MQDQEQTTGSTADPKDEAINREISAIKGARQATDQIIQQLRSMVPTEERKVAILKLQEGVMWLGMDLKRIHSESGVGNNPYPASYDPSSPRIEPTADNLKL